MAGRLLPNGSNWGRTDPTYGGTYRIRGTVRELSVPGPYRVCLYDKTRGTIVASTLSATNGAYTFNRVGIFSAFVIAFDHGDAPVNAAVSDQLNWEPVE